MALAVAERVVATTSDAGQRCGTAVESEGDLAVGELMEGGSSAVQRSEVRNWVGLLDLVSPYLESSFNRSSRRVQDICIFARPQLNLCLYSAKWSSDAIAGSSISINDNMRE
ncbi:hypothetical protein NL676_035476 [Syzygium grande]|nr:hypothetical protein NL676_035476 [Syzygium grande]